MRLSTHWFLLLVVPLLHSPGSSGLKIHFRYVHEAISSDRVEYRDQDRSRSEYRSWTGGAMRLLDLPLDVRYVRYGPHLASIFRCDLRVFELNLDAREYVAAPYPPKPFRKAQAEALGLKPLQYVASDKPTLRVETTTVDTGERKEFFGHTARHVITTRKKIPGDGRVVYRP